MEILRNLFVLAHIACPRYPIPTTIATDSMIRYCENTIVTMEWK